MVQIPHFFSTPDEMQQFINCLPALAFIEFPAQNKVIINNALKDYAGFQDTEKTIQEWEALIPADDLLIRNRLKEDFLFRDRPYSFSFGIRNCKGVIGLFQEQMQKLQLGQEQLLLSIAMEMPDRHYAENRKYRFEDQQWKELLNSIDLGIEFFRSVRNKKGEIIDFEFVFVNDATFRIIDIKNQIGQKIIGRRLLDVFPSLKNEHFPDYVRVVEEGGNFEVENHYQWDGLDMWFHQKVSKLDDGIVVTFEDIGERKAKEQKLKESQELLNSIFDSTTVGIDVMKAVRNEDGDLVDFVYQISNRHALNTHTVFGITVEPGTSMNSVYPAVRESHLFDALLRVISTGKTFRDELFFEQNKVKTWFYFNYIKYGDGIVVTHLDISKNRESSESLKKSNELLEAILNTSSAAIEALEAVRNKEGEIIDFVYTMANKRSRDIQRGFSKNALEGRRLLSLYPNLKVNGLFHQLKDVVDKNHPIQLEVPYQIDGQIKWFLSNYGKSGDNGLILTYIEITRMKRAEEKLKDALHKINLNQKNLVRMIDSTDDFICSVDRELKFTAFNKAYRDEFERIFGVKIALGMSMIEAANTLPEMADKMLGYWKRALSGEKGFIAGEFGSEDKNDYQIQFHHILGAENEILGLTGFAKNLSREQKIQKALNDAHEFLLLSENLPNIVFTLTLKGKIEYLNAAFFRFTGLPKKQYQNTDFRKLIHPEDFDKLAMIWENKIYKKKKVDGEIRFRIRNKSRIFRWVQLRIVPVLNAKNEIQNWLGSITDIHEELINEETLRKAAEEFRQIAGGLPQMVWVTDPEGKSRYFNQRWYNYTGLSEAESLGEGWLQQIHPHDRKRTAKVWKDAFSNVKEYFIEYRIKDKEQRYRWFLGRAIPLMDKAGKVEKWFGTCTDIEDQKKQQRQLQLQNKKLNDLNEYLENFVNAVAHDLRSPVANIKGLINLLNIAKDEPLRKRALDNLQLSIDRLDSTVIGLIELIEAQHLKGDSAQSLQLDSCFEFVHKDFEPDLENIESNLQVDFRIKQINFVKVYIESAFRNLLSNAIKYRQQDRPLEISISSWRENDFVVISFSDNGIGIDLNTYGKNLFKPFSRFTRQGEGKGIGLHIVNHMFRREGGRLEVESEVGEGTTFRLYIRK